MRTFIAIELPKEIKDALAQLQSQLKSTSDDVKWVEPQNIHLTIKFLGERDDKKIEKIMRILEETAKDNHPYEAKISSLGAFPKIETPRVIWVGIDKGDNETKQIAKKLEEEIAKAGIPKEERPFSSHITIGRTRSGLGLDKLVRSLKNLEVSLAEKKLNFLVTKITLYKSTLTPKGPVYEILKEVNLKIS